MNRLPALRFAQYFAIDGGQSLCACLYGEDGHEAAYQGYSRVDIPRTAEHWSVEGGIVSNAKPIEFARSTGGDCAVLAVGLCGGETQLGHRYLSKPLTISPGGNFVVPRGFFQIAFSGH